MKRNFFPCLTLMLMILSGCASSGGGGQDDKEALVTKRIYEFWEARIAGDTKKAYGFLSPGSQVALSFEGFVLRSKNASYRKVEVEKVVCEKDICEAWTYLTYDHAKMKGVRTPGREQWLLDRGNAWYVFPE